MVQLHSVLALYKLPSGAPSVMLPADSVSCVSTAQSCGGDSSLLQARLMGPGNPHVASMSRVNDHMTEVVSSPSAHVMESSSPDTPKVPARCANLACQANANVLTFGAVDVCCWQVCANTYMHHAGSAFDMSCAITYTTSRRCCREHQTLPANNNRIEPGVCQTSCSPVTLVFACSCSWHRALRQRESHRKALLVDAIHTLFCLNNPGHSGSRIVSMHW
jgi:hypothetical protein